VVSRIICDTLTPSAAARALKRSASSGETLSFKNVERGMIKKD
jgi:hypothetical protein